MGGLKNALGSKTYDSQRFFKSHMRKRPQKKGSEVTILSNPSFHYRL